MKINPDLRKRQTTLLPRRDSQFGAIEQVNSSPTPLVTWNEFLLSWEPGGKVSNVCTKSPTAAAPPTHPLRRRAPPRAAVCRAPGSGHTTPSSPVTVLTRCYRALPHPTASRQERGFTLHMVISSQTLSVHPPLITVHLHVHLHSTSPPTCPPTLYWSLTALVPDANSFPEYFPAPTAMTGCLLNPYIFPNRPCPTDRFGDHFPTDRCWLLPH